MARLTSPTWDPATSAAEDTAPTYKTKAHETSFVLSQSLTAFPRTATPPVQINIVEKMSQGLHLFCLCLCVFCTYVYLMNKRMNILLCLIHNLIFQTPDKFYLSFRKENFLMSF